MALVDFSTAALLFAAVMTLMFVGRIPVKVHRCYRFGRNFNGWVLLYGIGKYTEINIGSCRYNCRDVLTDLFTVIQIQKLEKTTQARFCGDGPFTTVEELVKGPGGSEVRNYMAAAYNDFIFRHFWWKNMVG